MDDTSLDAGPYDGDSHMLSIDALSAPEIQESSDPSYTRSPSPSAVPSSMLFDETLGLYVGLDGRPIQFSAGSNASSQRARAQFLDKRRELLARLESLELYDHEIFGQTGDASELLEDSDESSMCETTRECGVEGVPTLKALRKLQATLRTEVKLQPQHHVSALGKHFYAVHPTQLYALDFGNPLVRPFMMFYPEIADVVSEMWQAEKMTNEVDIDTLSPMWADWKLAPQTHFYVRELAQLSDGRLVMPMRWVVVNSQVFFDGFFLSLSETTNTLSLAERTVHRTAASLLSLNLLNLGTGSFTATFDHQFSYGWMTTNPHPVRSVAQGRPAFRLRIGLWSDDASGNVSKQYNPHMNVCSQNSTLPHNLLKQQYFVRFHATSQAASSSELMAGIYTDFNKNTWTSAYDCQLGQDVVFQIVPNLKVGDNPQQSEDCSHIGVRGSYNCRRDKTGGTTLHKESAAGYEELFKPGLPRKPSETVDAVKQQIRQACLGVATSVTAIQTSTGIKDKIALHWIDILIARSRELQDLRISNKSASQDTRLRGLKGPPRTEMKDVILGEIQDELWEWVITQPPAEYATLAANDPSRHDLRPGVHFNPLLCLSSLDVHADTPTEVLHTWQLGHIKYLWHQTTSSWDDAKCKLFGDRLACTSIDGLTLPPIRADWVMQYKNSLIGKHFKMLEQIGVFHLHGLGVEGSVFDLWKAMGELGALLWFPAIKKSGSSRYLADVQILIDNILDIWATIDPAKMLSKVKLHTLTHLPEDIRRHGPPILYATELYECFNGVFRLCSVYSNRLSPSRDIARDMADMERLKHQVAGGWWKDSNGRDVQAGSRVRSYLTVAPELQRRLGWVDHTRMVSGFAKPLPRARRAPMTWSALEYEGRVQPDYRDEPSATWEKCVHVISRSHDICEAGSWVFFSCQSSQTAIGRIQDIRLLQEHSKAPSAMSTVRVVLETAGMESEPDPLLHMPVIRLTGDLVGVQAKQILFIFNAQHDCFKGACPIQGHGKSTQEGHKTSTGGAVIKHTAFNRYFLNIHALHNAHLVRESLPYDLWRPRALWSDREKKHSELATQMQAIAKRKRAQKIIDDASARSAAEDTIEVDAELGTDESGADGQNDENPEDIDEISCSDSEKPDSSHSTDTEDDGSR
ncbi:hypothetical protein EV122DRAFT_295623 [Schizophyllum commune]